MVTLLEQVINRDRTSGTKCFAFVNELKISKASTGNKLKIKNFEDLEKGDMFYIYGVTSENLYLEGMDFIKKGAKNFWSYKIGTVHNYKEIQSIENYEKTKTSSDDIANNPIYKTNIPLFFEKRMGILCFIYSTSLELINTLLNDKKALDAEMAKGNIIQI